MIGVMSYMYACCERKGIPIGLAPNIEVSLIVQPDDGRYLQERNQRFYWNELLLKAKKFLAYQSVFKRQLKPRKITANDEDYSAYRTNWKDTVRYSPLAAASQNDPAS